jgi:hypothetical protein
MRNLNQMKNLFMDISGPSKMRRNNYFHFLLKKKFVKAVKVFDRIRKFYIEMLNKKEFRLEQVFKSSYLIRAASEKYLVYNHKEIYCILHQNVKKSS